MISGLDLFAWGELARPDKSAEVLAFPLARRSALVRKTANALLVINGKRTDAYWRKVVASLRKEMATSGVSDEQAEIQLRAFYQSVEARMRARFQRDPSGDAA